jgi:streptogramin lyase
MEPCRILLGCILASLCLLSGGAWAQIVAEFSTGITAGAQPLGITTGPDGNLWFTESGGDRIGRITSLGVVTEFSSGITGGAGLRGIAAGPDGNLWFTEINIDRIGRITPLGVVTEFSFGITAGAEPYGITAGADGNLWFTEYNGNRIGRITPSGVVTEFSIGITPGAQPYGITAGPDGNLWFTELNGNRIGRITSSGVVSEFSTGITGGAGPFDITAGPDGDSNLWFTEINIGRIGRITLLGAVTEFSAGLTGAEGIAAGPDGNLWFTDYSNDHIGRITPFGVVTEFSTGISVGAHPIRIAAGPDGNLWFTEFTGNRIGRITAPVIIVSPPELAYTPVTPCRLLDTRVARGAFALRSGRNYAASDNTRIGQAGGNPAGCGIPIGPEALALTITAVLPTAVGNLVAYPANTTVPLASALNFLAGQIIANTTVVSITPGGGDNFSLFNNSDGQTEVVVDVVGYFWEYASADCTKTTIFQSVGAGGTVDVGATCATGYVPVGGGCSVNAAGASNWLARGATLAGDGYHCNMLNGSATTVSVFADALCCRRAGR